MQKFSDRAKVDIIWLPFLLNANAPLEGVPVKQYLMNKMGASESRYHAMRDNLCRMGEECGIKFHRNDDALIANTVSAHRLFQRVVNNHGNERALKLYDAILEAYHEKAEHISNHDILTRLAAEAVPEATGVREFLASDEGRDAVLQADNRAKTQGVGGVPYFLFFDMDKDARRPFNAFSGAQPVAMFEQVFSSQL